MILARTEQGEIELNGEPIAAWYKKRGIRPCPILYTRIIETGPVMCLLGAMVFATLERQMDIQEAEEWWKATSLSPIHLAAEVLKEEICDLGDLELGFLLWRLDPTEFDGYRNVAMVQLGHDAGQSLLECGD